MPTREQRESYAERRLAGIRRQEERAKKKKKEEEARRNDTNSNNSNTGGSSRTSFTAEDARKSAQTSQEKFKEQIKKQGIVNKQGEIKAGRLQEYRQLRERLVTEPRRVEAFTRTGVSSPVIRQSGESSSAAAERSAGRTAQMVADVQREVTGKDTKVTVRVSQPVKQVRPTNISNQRSILYLDEQPRKEMASNTFQDDLKYYRQINNIETQQGTTTFNVPQKKMVNVVFTPLQKPIGITATPKGLEPSKDIGTGTFRYGLTEKTAGTQITDTLTGVKNFGTGFVEGLFVLPVKGIIDTVKNPIETGKGIIKVIKNPYDFGYAAKNALIRDPGTSLGIAAGTLAAPKIFKTGITKTKDVYVRVGSTKVPASQVISPQVLEQGKTMPLSTSTPASVRAFESADNTVVTMSPKKIKGTSVETVGDAAKGLEDPGIYVTPKGEGSPYFLRLEDSSFNYLSEGSVGNPFKNLFSVPTATEFKTTGVTRYSPQVLESVGFEDVTKFQRESLAGTGKVVITKRSEIGQGTAKGQGFQGTTELEAVVPLDQTFRYTPSTTVGKIKGFDKYFEFEGRNIALRDAELVVSKDFVSPNTKGSKVFSGDAIRREMSYVEPSSSPGSITSSASVLSSSNGLQSSNVGLSSSSLSTGFNVNDSLVSGSSAGSVGSSSYSVSASRLSSSPGISSAISGTPRRSGSSGSSASSFVQSRPASSISGGSSVSGISSLSGGSRFSGGGSSFLRGRSSSGYSFFIPRIITRTRTPKGDGDRRGFFDVSTRRFGQEVILGRGLNLQQAAKLGKSTVLGTAAASVKLRRTGTSSTPSTTTLTQFSGLLGSQFRTSKTLGDDVFIEQNKYRINTAGELQEITFKGIFTQKKGKRKGLGGLL